MSTLLFSFLGPDKMQVHVVVSGYMLSVFQAHRFQASDHNSSTK